MLHPTKAKLISDIKRAMRKEGRTELEIERHYEMLTLEGRTLSYLRYPDHVWSNKDIPMDVLRACRNDLLDLET